MFRKTSVLKFRKNSQDNICEKKTPSQLFPGILARFLGIHLGDYSSTRTLNLHRIYISQDICFNNQQPLQKMQRPSEVLPSILTLQKNELPSKNEAPCH